MTSRTGHTKIKPRILILAGPNGAGKTTFAREYVQKVLGFNRFVNADLIATGLSPFDPSLASISAARIMLDRVVMIFLQKQLRGDLKRD